MTALARLLGRLPRVTLVVGKGGVGKTTVAAGLASTLAGEGISTLVLTTDPAGTLADAMQRPLARCGALAPVSVRPELDLWVIDAAAARDAFLTQWRSTIATILDRGTYLDRDDIDGLVDAALPGADEIFALLALGDLLGTPGTAYQRILIDTAPTGHTLRLIELPTTFRALVTLFDAMQEKHRFMVRALTHRYRDDNADRFLTDLRTRVDRIGAVLSSGNESGAIVVTRDEPVVAAETARYVSALGAADITVLAVVVNAMTKPVGPSRLIPMVPAGQWYGLDRLCPPTDLDEAAAAVRQLREISIAEPAPSGIVDEKPVAAVKRAEASSGLATVIPAIHPLTVVAGKGGVGKTTVACGIAIVAADRGQRTLLVSTDPAPSIADALSQPIGDDEVPVAEVPGLVARQMDATAAFVRLRTEYQERVDSVFSGLMSHGIDADHDRAILRDVLALAPPGIDEVYALSVIGDALAGGPFDRIVVDPAPTGHLLRLLEMPAVALAWTHRLMRLMLKYKDVVSVGSAGEELLGFARRTRSLETILQDPARSGIILVSLDEPLVRGESERLAAVLGSRGLTPTALVWNRTDSKPPRLRLHPAIAQAAAPSRPVIGVAALRRWGRFVDHPVVVRSIVLWFPSEQTHPTGM